MKILHLISSVLVRRLAKDYVKKHTRLILMTVLLLLVISATTSMQPLLLQQAFDKVFREKNMDYLMILPMAIIIIGLIQALATYFSNILMSRFGNAMIADMRRDFFKQIINNEIEFHAEYNSGNLMFRSMNEIIAMASGVQMFFNSWARQFITSLGLIAVMFYQSVELSIIALSALLIAFYPITHITKRIKKLIRQSNETNGVFQTRLLESFAGIRVIKAFAKESFETQKIDEYIVEIEQITNKTFGWASVTAPLMQTLAGVAVAFVIWYGGYQLIQGKMTEGNMIAFITSLLMVSRPIRSLTSAASTMSTAIVNAERFYAILDTKSRYASRDEGVKINIKQGGIVFDNVSFAYPNGTQALNNVSFAFEAGKRTALVGHSGSGKSTIFNLLLKFYEHASGVIKIDNQPISTASINSVRSAMALVSQDIFIFDDTARNNIGYGREGASEAEIIEAAKAAKCHDFIIGLPNGYDTKLGFYGQNLSGGQKQRIAIARAFLRNSPILLLDEATSALDPKTEAEIQESLEKLSKDRTTIVIAHRLSTVMKADQMVLMHKGEVAATGTHEQLLASSPAYKDLFGI